MISKKNLSRKLQSLTELLKNYESSSDSQWKKEAFADAYSLCTNVISSVDLEDYDEASRLWKQLERVINDSIPVNEGFLSRYMPLRQSIINFGLR